jgi:hypothetical protein
MDFHVLRRWSTSVGVLTISLWLLSGCAGYRTLSVNVDSSNYPQIVIPGATLTDVRGLAKGAAQSKGWSIVKSRDDLLVVQRPLDASSPAVAALGDTKSTTAPVIEATTVFREESGGVLVAVGATLITQPPGSKTPKRTDYTNNYRDALTQSLESLRANWAANRQRIANAIPTHAATIDTSAPNAASSNPLVQEWSQTLAEENAAKKRTPGGAVRTEAPAPAKAPLAATAEPVPTTLAPAPVIDGSRSAAVLPTAEATGTPTTAAARPLPAPEPVQLTPLPEPATPAPAPVVDASSEVAPEDNMMALTQKSGAGAWAFYAEQVALVRGCTVTDAGVQLIESRGDGELYKVPCEGADSFLLKCQNGACQELAAANRRPAPPQPIAPVAKTEVKRPQPNPARTETKPAKADTKATKPEPKTVKADAKATKPEPKTVKADAKTTKPEPKTVKADAKAAKPEPKTAKADAKATKPEPKTAKADAKAAKPESKTAKADAKATKPEPKTAKAEAKAAKPESKTAKADAKATKPAPKAEKSEGKSPKSK